MSSVKLHLKCDREDFIPQGSAPIIEQSCNYDHFKELMTLVGKPSNWDTRPEYVNPNQEKTIKDKFQKHACRLWTYDYKGETIGFCQVAQVEDLTSLFKDTSNVVEMYKMGLFPKYVGRGLGNGYVSNVLKELFNNYSTVYLNTRDSNVVNSVPFWKEFGFKIFKTETLTNDLIQP